MTLPTDFDIFSPVKRSIPLCVQIRANSWPSARDCASSFSWCGKTRSSPPPWISNAGPSSSSAITEHSMCQPGRPRPHGESHDVSSPGLFAFQSAKSRGSSLSGFGSCSSHLVRPLARELAVVREARDAEVDVAVDLVREAALDQLLDERDDPGDRLGRLRQVVGHAEPERVGVLEVPLASPARRARRSRPAPPRRSCR